MKRCVLVWLFAVLLLTGCAGIPGIAPTEPDETPSLVVEDGKVTARGYWSLFYYETQGDFMPSGRPVAGSESSITVTHREQGAVTANFTLSCDGENYILESGEETKLYPYLLQETCRNPAWADCDLAECFFLSQDKNMTAQRYFSREGEENFPDTVLVYQDQFTFGPVEEFGQAPAELLWQIEDPGTRWGIITGSSALYGDICTGSGILRNHCIRRDFTGKELARVTYNVGWIPGQEETPALAGAVDLRDGGFVLAYQQADGVFCLSAHDADGTQRWCYAFPEQKLRLDCLIERNSDLYFFGVTDTELGDDLFLCRFGTDGKLKTRRILGGSNMEWLTRVAPTDTGFLLNGYTQSKDGDFPLSPDGYMVDFAAEVTENLELIAVAEPACIRIDSLCGYVRGEPVYSRDAILEPGRQDRLPEDACPVRVFDWEDGYVVLRSIIYMDEAKKLTPPCVSAAQYYCRMILTGYKADGTPLWQAVSPVS